MTLKNINVIWISFGKKSQKETCKFAIIKKFYVEIYSPQVFSKE